MKRTLIFATVVLCAASPVWALRFMGPPTTKAKAGQFGVGFDWSHSQFDIRLDDVGTAKLESDVYYARLLFGVADWAEISGMIGMSEIEDDVEPEFRSSNDVTWGVGSKLRFWQSGSLDLGAAFQLTSLRGDDELAIDPFTTLKSDVDAYIIELAVGPTYTVDRISVYGGPFVHFITGDLEEKIGSFKDKIDIEQEGSEFGAYVGLSADIAENTNVSVEYHWTDDSYAIGVGLVHRFGAGSKPKPRSRATSGQPRPRLKKTPQKALTAPIREDKLKTDEKGRPVTDKDGNFIFVPVE